MNDYVIGLAAPAWVRTRGGVSRAAHGAGPAILRVGWSRR